MAGRGRIALIAGAIASAAVLSSWRWGSPPPMSAGFPSSLNAWLQSGDETLSLSDIDHRIQWICIVPAYQELEGGLADFGISVDIPLYIPNGSFALVLDYGKDDVEYALIDYASYGVWTKARRCHSSDSIGLMRTRHENNERELLILSSERHA